MVVVVEVAAVVVQAPHPSHASLAAPAVTLSVAANVAWPASVPLPTVQCPHLHVSPHPRVVPCPQDDKQKKKQFARKIGVQKGFGPALCTDLYTR